ncbi:MAG: hypothetical protein R2762_25140 [Bryobacteraceae bacterium]
MLRALAPFAAAALLAQAPPDAGRGSAPRGAYHFAQIVLPSPGEPARNLGGAIYFDGAGGFQVRARMATGTEPAVDVSRDGECRPTSSGAIVMANPAHPESSMDVWFDDSAQVLIASPKADGYEMFVAVKAPSAGQGNGDLTGFYGGAYVGLAGGAAAGLATAFVELTADGAGRFIRSSIAGHAAAIDDVNRLEKAASSGYAVRADGTGTAEFAAPSDFLSGQREILVSEGGRFLLAYSLDPARRDLLFAVRKNAEAVAFQFRGDFRIVELLAENGFVFHPENARFGAAGGVVRASEGIALVAEQVRMDGRRTTLTTVNRYSLGATGWFGPTFNAAVNNFALSDAGDVFVGAQIDAQGKLTLEHGIFAGVRARPVAVSSGPSIEPLGIANITTTALPALSLAPGAIATIAGSGFGAGSVVLVNGETITPRAVSARRVDFDLPEAFPIGPASIQVESNGVRSNTVETEVQMAAPTLAASLPDGRGAAAAARAGGDPVTTVHPAAPGETVSLFLTGLGSHISEVQVLFDGVPGEVLFAGPAPGYPGIDQINVTIPADLEIRGPVAVALSIPGAFSDLAELPVSPRQ